MQFNVFPHDSKFDFMRLRFVSTGLSIALLVVAFGAMFTQGFNFALDFTGGTSVELRFDKPADVDAVRERLDAAGFPGAQVQTYGSGADLLVRLQPREATGDETGDADVDSSQLAEEVVKIVSTPENPAHRLSSGSTTSASPA